MTSRVAGPALILVMTACAANEAPPPSDTTSNASTPAGGSASGATAVHGNGAQGSTGGAANAGTGASAAIGGSGTGDVGGSDEPAAAGASGTAAAGGGGQPSNVIMSVGATMSVHGGTGGSLYVDECSADEAMAGLAWVVGDHPDYPGNPRVLGLRVVCVKIYLVTGSNYAVRTGIKRQLTQRGSADVAGASAGTSVAVEDEVIVSLGASFGDAAMVSMTMLGGIKEVAISSAPFVVELGDDGYSASPGTVTALPLIGAAQDGDTIYPEQACPDGQVARGLQIRAGAWVDAVGLLCGTATLTTDAG